MNEHCPLCGSRNLEEQLAGTVAEYPNITRIYRCRECDFTWKILPAYRENNIDNDRTSTNNKEN